MGFIDQIERERQRAIQQEAKKMADVMQARAKASIQTIQEKSMKDQLYAERIKRLPIELEEDCEILTGIVGQLPDLDFGSYFESVREFTKYDKVHTTIYFRNLDYINGRGDNSLPQIPQETSDNVDNLLKQLESKGFKSGVRESRSMFLGDGPFRYGLFGLSTRVEPTGAGIGVLFEKDVYFKSKRIEHHKLVGDFERSYSLLYTDVITDAEYQAVYARFIAPANVVLTGGNMQLQVPVHEIEVIDDALERVFRNPRSKFIHREFVEKPSYGSCSD